jgi:hypothetical protein
MPRGEEKLSNQWLYEQMLLEKPTWKPDFALQSTLNWAKSLSFEISEEHGGSPREQIDSCRLWFTQRIKNRSGKIPLSPIFGPLFHSLTFSVSLVSLKEHGACGPWMFPGAVVLWYYAIYNAFKSILAAYDNRETHTHNQMIKSLIGNDIRPKLPHPFNMVAHHSSAEEYDVTLPNYTNAKKYKLAQNFDYTRPTAQGMLLSYLSGTASWQVEKVKEKLLKNRNFQFGNFRSNGARKIRDKCLPPEVNFLNCAFRYRGKANYRDSMFLAYGHDDMRLDPEFISDLINSSRFAFICGLVYAESRIGIRNVNDFLEDVNRNFRGQPQATAQEKFWTVL